MSTSPLVLHIVRPYATAEEYLAAEAWTIDARAMLLVDADDLAPETAVLFDVALSNGDKLIRAEGKVANKIAAQGGRPGGLRVKFKRYGAATKAFIDRAVKAQQGPAPAADAPPVSIAPVSRNSVTEVEMQKAEAAAPAVIEAALPAPAAPAPPPPSPPPALAAPDSRPEAREPSGVHRRPAGPVEAPPHREELLARLRERAASVDINAISARAPEKTG